MQKEEIIGLAAGGLALLSAVPYILSILRGNTKPSRSAYAIWLVIDTVTIVSYYSVGASTTLWAFASFWFSTSIVFLLSLKYGMKGFTKVDSVSILIGTISILLWVMTSDPLITLYSILVAKVMGYIPIIHKSFVRPKTENTLAWNIVFVASVLNLFAMKEFSIHIFMAPFILAVLDLVIVVLLSKPWIKELYIRRNAKQIEY